MNTRLIKHFTFVAAVTVSALLALAAASDTREESFQRIAEQHCGSDSGLHFDETRGAG